MAPRARLKILGIVVLVALASVALSGCAPVAGAVVGAIHSAEQKPITSVGDCWKSTYKDANEYATWNGSLPVDCSRPHQLDTFAIETLTGSYAEEFDSSGTVPDPLLNDAEQACDQAAADSLFSVLDAGRMDFPFFLPSEEEWARGSRSVRCDVGVIALGSSYLSPTLSDLPSFATLKKLTDKNPVEYDYCANVPDASADGPYSQEAKYTDCRKNPVWVHYQSNDVLSPAGPYPGLAAMTASYGQTCSAQWGDAAHVIFVFFPSEDDWNAGDRTIECWAGRKP